MSEFEPIKIEKASPRQEMSSAETVTVSVSFSGNPSEWKELLLNPDMSRVAGFGLDALYSTASGVEFRCPPDEVERFMRSLQECVDYANAEYAEKVWPQLMAEADERSAKASGKAAAIAQAREQIKKVLGEQN